MGHGSLPVPQSFEVSHAKHNGDISRIIVLNQLSRSFQASRQPSSCLYHLLPPIRDTSVLSRLRTAKRFTRRILRTKNSVLLLKGKSALKNIWPKINIYDK